VHIRCDNEHEACPEGDDHGQSCPVDRESQGLQDGFHNARKQGERNGGKVGDESKKGWWWCVAVTQLERTATFVDTLIVSLLAPRRDKQSFCSSSLRRQEHVSMICYEEGSLTTISPIFYHPPTCRAMTTTPTLRVMSEGDTRPTTIETTLI
jgi:hypothetical protein